MAGYKEVPLTSIWSLLDESIEFSNLCFAFIGKWSEFCFAFLIQANRIDQFLSEINKISLGEILFLNRDEFSFYKYLC